MHHPSTRQNNVAFIVLAILLTTPIACIKRSSSSSSLPHKQPRFRLTKEFLSTYLNATDEQPKLLMHRPGVGTTVIACTPSKNGITTTRSVFYQLAHPQAVTPTNPYDNSHFSWVDSLPIDEAYDLLSTDRSVVRIAVLRNPYERIASAYHNKIVEPKDFDYVLDHVRLVCNFSSDRNITFDEFTECVTSQSPLTVDRHFVPQVQWCGLNHISYHHYLTTHNLAQQLLKVMESNQHTVYGTIPRLNRALGKHKVHWQSFYSNASRAMVESYYAADFQYLAGLFGKGGMDVLWDDGLVVGAGRS